MLHRRALGVTLNFSYPTGRDRCSRFLRFLLTASFARRRGQVSIAYTFPPRSFGVHGALPFPQEMNLLSLPCETNRRGGPTWTLDAPFLHNLVPEDIP